MMETGLHRSGTFSAGPINDDEPAGAAMDGGAGRQRDPVQSEWPTQVAPELMADLQAGLLDDATATRLRHRARTDPEAARIIAALDRVRREVADLGADGDAADVPASVTARIGAALRTAPTRGHRVVAPARRGSAAHSDRRSLPRLRLAAAVAGGCAVLAAIAIGVAMLTDSPPPTPSAGPTADHITVSPRVIPLSDPQILELLTMPPDYGPLTDPNRRASCLRGLGYSALTKALGARPVDMRGRPAVLMVLPADSPDALVALIVDPNCSSANTALLADTVLPRP